MADPSLPHPLRYVIIGGGIAGLSAAQAIRQADPAGRLTIISAEPHRIYSRPGLAYLLNGQVPLSQIFPWTTADLRSLHASFLQGLVVSLDLPARLLTLADGRSLTFDRLLLATGAPAVLPDLPGIHLEGVVTLDTLDDAQRILSMAKRSRRAVIVGGGITAVELAEGLAARGVETHYLLRKDRFWGQVLDPEESRLVEAGMTHEGIRLHYHTNVAQVLGPRGRVSGVLTEAGGTIPCQLVGFAIGILPNLDLAQAAHLSVDRGILVDEYLETSVRGVYSAGDAAQVFEPRSGKHVLDSLWWMAQEQGRTAGANMAGERIPYQRGIPFNVTKIGGIITTIVGAVGQRGSDDDLVSIVHGDSEGWRESGESFAVESDAGGSRIRLMVGPETIEGAVIMGDQALSRPVADLVRRRLPLGRFRQQLIHSPQRGLQTLIEYSRRQSARHLTAVA